MLYRAYYKFSDMRSASGTPTGITYGFIYILKSLLATFKPVALYVVFDGGRSKERMAILPDYKNRDKKEGFDKDDFYRQRDLTLELLRCFGVKVIMRKKTEADDMIWLLIRKLKRKFNITLVSSDKDFNQLLSDAVSIWNPSKKMLITMDNIEAAFGYTHKQCVDYLILDGDASDHIPGMPGVGKKTIEKFFNQYESIESFLSEPDSKFMKWDKGKLKYIYDRNKALIDLRSFVTMYLKSSDIKIINKNNKVIDETELRFICASSSIRTFVKPPFIKEFKNLL